MRALLETSGRLRLAPAWALSAAAVLQSGCGACGSGAGTATSGPATPGLTSTAASSPALPELPGAPDGGVLVLRDGGLYTCPRPTADGRMHYDRCVPADPPATASRLYVIPPDILGPLPRDEVRMLLDASLPRIVPCFEKVLEKEPGITGFYRTEMVIDAAGDVTRTFTESAFGEHKVEDCVAPILKEWRFVGPGGVSRLNVRFELKPPGEELEVPRRSPTPGFPPG